MKPKKNWRLSKTLERRIEIRPIENDDVKYAWAAYKKGGLNGMPFPNELDAQGFKDAFEAYVLSNAHAAWTISTQTKNGFIPAGLVLGSWGPQEAFMIIVGIVWFPWASKRNIVEGVVGFFNRIRKEMNWIGFASPEHMPVYKVCCIHGIMNRIGTSLSGGKVAVYEGRN